MLYGLVLFHSYTRKIVGQNYQRIWPRGLSKPYPGKGFAVAVKPDVRLWKADELSYKQVGPDGLAYCNPIPEEIGKYHAGYLVFNGGTLEWTEHGDELIWVLEGHVEIFNGSDVIAMDPGDLVFLKDGLSLRMTGSQDARIAYISTLYCQ